MHGVKHGAVLAAVLAVALTPAMAAAQSAAGFRGGLRSADLESPARTDAVQHFVAAGYLGMGLSDRVALQFELVYGSRGASSVPLGEDGLDPAAPGVDLTMEYIEVPVLLRAGFPSDRLLPSLFAGPYVGFLLGCEVGQATESWACRETERDQRFHPRATDYGVILGAGLDLLLGESTLFLDVRYSRSILSIQAGEFPMDARHAGLEISGGFAFPLGR